MQIHQLNTLGRLPEATDYLAIDTGFDTAKIAANELFADSATVGQAVSDWLDAHPEATTTVQDGSLTEAKFSSALKQKTIKDYVTPEMFGAVGDGVTDDTTAVQNAINNGNVIFCKGTYAIASTITINGGKTIKGIKHNELSNDDPTFIAISAIDKMFIINGAAVEIDNVLIDCNDLANYGFYTSIIVSRLYFSQVTVAKALTACYYLNSYLSIFNACMARRSPKGFSFNETVIDGAMMTSLILQDCYADYCDIGYIFNKVIYSSLISCACDNATTAYSFVEAQINLLRCGAEVIVDTILLCGNSVRLVVSGFNILTAGGASLKFVKSTGYTSYIRIDDVGGMQYCQPLAITAADSSTIIQLPYYFEIARAKGGIIIPNNIINLTDGVYTSDGVTVTVTDGIAVVTGSSATVQAITVGSFVARAGTYIGQSNTSANDFNVRCAIAKGNNNVEYDTGQIDFSWFNKFNILDSNDGETYYIKIIVRAGKTGRIYPAIFSI